LGAILAFRRRRIGYTMLIQMQVFVVLLFAAAILSRGTAWIDWTSMGALASSVAAAAVLYRGRSDLASRRERT
jgi:hypothetical protein